MKKLTAALLAVMMILAGVSALAETPETPAAPEASPERDPFDSVWRDGFDYVEINCMDGYWAVVVSLESGTRLWEYTCIMNDAQDALVSDSTATNRELAVRWNEEGSMEEREVVSSEASAIFTLDEDGCLLWKDEAGDAGAGRRFVKSGWFEGTYACDDYSLSIFWDTEDADGTMFSGYKAQMDLESENGLTTWIYSCSYDPQDDRLYAFIAVKETQEKEGEAITTVYDKTVENGAYPACFAFDGEGNLHWIDNVEQAGEGKIFMLSNG